VLVCALEQERITMSQLSTGAADYEKPASTGGSKTIGEFCDDNRISRSFYYQMKRLGIGPDEMRHASAVRITHEAEKRWQEAGERRAREVTAA
jgi:hypothetical protein